jgi:hypothetical protein
MTDLAFWTIVAAVGAVVSPVAGIIGGLVVGVPFAVMAHRRRPKLVLDFDGTEGRGFVVEQDWWEESPKKHIEHLIDTETPTGRAMWQMIGVLAELERSLITERTRAGVKAAQRRGVKFGRKPKLTPDRLAHARKLIDQGKTPTEAAKIMGVSRATVYRAL